jgi:hypothetical protein
MLRRLVHIAKGDLLPSVFLIGNATAVRLLTTMSIEQQEIAMSDKIEIVSEDGSHWLKKFEDLTPREMRVVYDERTKEFRSLQGQKDWIEQLLQRQRQQISRKLSPSPSY